MFLRSSDEAQAPADVVRRAATNVSCAAKLQDAARWTCEWRVPSASFGIDPTRERSFDLNLTVRKVTDNLWLMYHVSHLADE